MMQYDSSMKNKPAYALGSVDNVLLLLHLLRDQGKVKVSEAATELGIARSTAHRLLAMLVYRDFAVRDDNHTYLPGPFLTSMAGITDGSAVRVLRTLAQPHMEALCARVAETVNLTVRAGTEVRFLASVESTRLLRVGDRRGTILPAHLTSGGKVLLAELPREQLRRLYEQDPGDTGAEWAALIRDLDATRARGYGLNVEETEDGVSAVGVAIRNGQGTAIGALSIAAPTSRLTSDRITPYVRELRHTVTELEHTLTDFPTG
jgi:DNA-binding IclR family transcriptional regulator